MQKNSSYVYHGGLSLCFWVCRDTAVVWNHAKKCNQHKQCSCNIKKNNNVHFKIDCRKTVESTKISLLQPNCVVLLLSILHTLLNRTSMIIFKLEPKILCTYVCTYKYVCICMRVGPFYLMQCTMQIQRRRGNVVIFRLIWQNVSGKFEYYADHLDIATCTDTLLKLW